VYPAKYQHLNVPSIPLHVSSRHLCWSFHILSITLPQLLLSFGTERLGFMEKKILCIIPQKYSEHHWVFLMITITVFWCIWQCPLPDDNIHIWSVALISSFQVFVPHCSYSITQLLENFQFWYSSHKFFYILITHIIRLLQTQSQVWQTWRH